MAWTHSALTVRLALGISLLCHFIFFNAVELTFTAAPETPQPFFAFLGSLLESQELAPFTKRIKTQSGEIAIQPVAIPSQGSRFDPVTITTVSKPSYPEEITDDSKEYIKIHFLDNPLSDKQLREEWDMDQYLPKIIPLHLYRR